MTRAQLFGLTLMALLVSNSVVAAETFVYVSKSAEQEIQVYRLESDGQLTPTSTTKLDGGPGCLSVDAQRRFLFASVRTSTTLASFRINAADGSLTPLSSASLSPGANAAFVRPDASGNWLISASYTGGKVVVHPLVDGVIGKEAVQTVDTARTAHCVSYDRSNRWVFVPHVAPNGVYQFQFDPAAGKLTATSPAPGGADRAGPRHLAWHPTLDLAFTSDESGSSITAYRFDPQSGLAPVQTLSTLPADYQGGNTTAEVKVHPSGKFVWVSNRGHDSLAQFLVDDAGKLTVGEHCSTEKTPRSFDIDPSGRFAFGAGEGSGKLEVFTIDQSTGKLTRVQTYDVGKAVNWVLSVAAPGQ